jgi:hypothetical protein
MLLRLLVCVALMGPTAFAGWQRYLSGDGKGPSTDSPPAHPLAYFQVDPCARPDSDPLGRSLECTWEGKPPPTPAELKRRANVRTDLVEIGKIGAFKIYDLWYRRDGSSYPYADVRSVLIKTATDEYREINVQIRWGNVFPASEIVNLDGEPILIARSHDGGNHSHVEEALYMFRTSGLVTPDFKAVADAVAKLTPANMSVQTWTHDYATMTDRVDTYRNDLGLAPGSVQERLRIAVTYRFVDGHAVVTASKYEPYP